MNELQAHILKHDLAAHHVYNQHFVSNYEDQDRNILKPVVKTHRDDIDRDGPKSDERRDEGFHGETHHVHEVKGKSKPIGDIEFKMLFLYSFHYP